jgi:tetratricopeptide (TPR) repeat protein
VLVLCLALPAAALAQPSEVGLVEFPNSGAPEAQASFIEGLAQLHNFEYADAALQFRKAQEIDPGFAMAYWGEAMTANHPVWMEQDRDRALAILARLGPTAEARRAKAGSDREKAYLEAVEILYGEGTKHERDIAYADAMRKIHEAYPDDVDAAAFYALAILGTAHEGRDFSIYMKAAAVAEEAFVDHRRHPGILHYLIHAYDDPIHAPLGLRAARLYGEVAPRAAHAQHMTSHIFLAVGDWDDVVKANETAASVMNRARTSRAQPSYHCGHYNFWLLYGYLQQGRESEARSLLSLCREDASRTPPGPSVVDPDNSALHSLLQMRARYLVDSEAWDGEVAQWRVDLPPGHPAERVTFEWTEGMAAVGRADLSEARERLANLASARSALGAFLVEHPEDLGPAVERRAGILENELTASIRGLEGRRNEAVSILKAAAAEEEAIPSMFGPPFVDKPSSELLGETLLELERADEAAAAFRRALARTPERTLSLRGLADALERGGHKEESMEVRSRLHRIWRRADRH